MTGTLPYWQATSVGQAQCQWYQSGSKQMSHNVLGELLSKSLDRYQRDTIISCLSSRHTITGNRSSRPKQPGLRLLWALVGGKHAAAWRGRRTGNRKTRNPWRYFDSTEERLFVGGHGMVVGQLRATPRRGFRAQRHVAGRAKCVPRRTGSAKRAARNGAHAARARGGAAGAASAAS